MFNVSTVFTHKTLFEPMWCFQNCLLCSLHSIQFYILMSWGIDCSLMKKWPRLAVFSQLWAAMLIYTYCFNLLGKLIMMEEHSRFQKPCLAITSVIKSALDPSSLQFAFSFHKRERKARLIQACVDFILGLSI